MLALEFVSSYDVKRDMALPSEVQPEWHMIIHSLINERVEQLSNGIKIDLFCSLENQQCTSDLIMNVVMTHVAEALDELVFSEVSYYIIILL